MAPRSSLFDEINMASIRIKKTHQLDNAKVRDEIQHLADKLSQDLSAKYHWEGDRLVFKRSGASGHIDIKQGLVNVEIKLGLVLTPLKGKIEETVNSYLNERLT